MTQPGQTVRVVLDLDRTADRIAGSLDDGSVGPRPFYGWLELSALLEQTRARELLDPPDSERSSRTKP